MCLYRYVLFALVCACSYLGGHPSNDGFSIKNNLVDF